MRKGALMKSVSFKTYALWTLTCVLTMLYSIFENGDIMFILVSACNLIGSGTCAALIALRRHQLKMPIFAWKVKAIIAKPSGAPTGIRRSA